MHNRLNPKAKPFIPKRHIYAIKNLMPYFGHKRDSTCEVQKYDTAVWMTDYIMKGMKLDKNCGFNLHLARLEILLYSARLYNIVPIIDITTFHLDVINSTYKLLGLHLNP